jgi:hypothetical protein
MIELTYLMLVGLMATSYPELLTNQASMKLMIEPLEKRLELPYHKPDLPLLLADFGFLLSSVEKEDTFKNQQPICLFPSFFLRMMPAFEAFFEENQIT